MLSFNFFTWIYGLESVTEMIRAHICVKMCLKLIGSRNSHNIKWWLFHSKNHAYITNRNLLSQSCKYRKCFTQYLVVMFTWYNFSKGSATIKVPVPAQKTCKPNKQNLYGPELQVLNEIQYNLSLPIYSHSNFYMKLWPGISHWNGMGPSWKHCNCFSIIWTWAIFWWKCTCGHKKPQR